MMCARYIYESLAAEGLGTQEKNEDNYPVGMKNQQLLHNLVEDILQSALEKVQRDEIRHNSYVMTKIRLEGLIFEFLKDKPLHKIDIQVLEDFIRHMTDKKLSASTMQGYIAQMRKILRLLERKKILSSVPSFPPLKAQPNSRGGFTVTRVQSNITKI
jgi:S-adenosylmethionine:diacylglycerol 3-amino-3-carboxypropyl transferase